MEITSWIEAIATAIAAVAAIAALYYAHKAYIKDRTETNQQIDKLNQQLVLYGELVSLERKKRKSEIKPLFLSSGGSSNSQNITIRLKNNGKMALNTRAEIIKCDGLLINSHSANQNYVKNDGVIELHLSKSENDSTHITLIPFEINIKYEDEDGNLYMNNICWKNRGWIVSNQIELN